MYNLSSWLLLINLDMIVEYQPLSITRFISIPKDYLDLNSNSFVAGIIEGILDSSEFVRF